MLNTKLKQTLFFLLIFNFAVVNNLTGQIELGLKIGYNLSNINFAKNKKDLQDVPDYKEVKAIHFGLTSNIELKKKFGLNIDLFYIGKGFDSRPNVSSLNLENVLSLPISLTYEVLPKFKLLAGLELDHIFSRYWVDGLEYRSIRKRIGNDEFRKLDNFNFGPVLGLQYAFAQRWALDFRYVSIFGGKYEDTGQIYFRTYMFSLHFKFGKKD